MVRPTHELVVVLHYRFRLDRLLIGYSLLPNSPVVLRQREIVDQLHPIEVSLSCEMEDRNENDRARFF